MTVESIRKPEWTQAKLREFLRSRPGISIIGYTPSRNEAPWTDDNWHKIICNTLYRILTPEQNANVTVLFDLHSIQSIRRDKEHNAWLQNATVPVVVWEAQPDWPTSVSYPVQKLDNGQVLVGRIEEDGEILCPGVAFPSYLTNTISEQVALLLAWCEDTMTDCAVQGVDMSQGGPGLGEYAKQRPSVEFFLGVLYRSGIRVHIPVSSDLLKSADIYGLDSYNPLKTKLESHLSEMRNRLNQVNNELNRLTVAKHQMEGAISVDEYILGTHFPAEANHDGSPKNTDLYGKVPTISEQVMAQVDSQTRHDVQSNKEGSESPDG